jgi:integrase
VRVTFKGSKRIERTVMQWIARVRYVGLDGLEHEKKRRADPNNYARACELKREIANEIEEELRKPAALDAHTFRELAEYCEKHYFIPPVYSGERKVDGLRTYQDVLGYLKGLVEQFGDDLLSTITHARIRDYKLEQLAAPIIIRNKAGDVVVDRARSVTSVHRKLSVLRRAFNIGVRIGWIQVNPFAQGDPLIVLSHEQERMRILAYEEERELLEYCGGVKRRRFLPPALIFSLETGMREGEQFKLLRSDVDLGEGIITLRETITKSGRRRIVPINARVRPIIEQLMRESSDGTGSRLFDVRSVDKAFRSACKACGIAGYRWHDNRHTAIMRMLEAGLREAEVMKIVGHRDYRTFMRYVALHARRARELAEKMDVRRGEVERDMRAKDESAPVN